ncbi:multiheme c-type cytochrome, partial [Acidobacteriota bacterium]
MIKKPHLLSILVVALLAAFLTIAAMSDDQVKIQSKKSHAEKEWSMSGHADSDSEAFRHWDEDGEVSSRCAKCHTTTGYAEFIGTGQVGAQAPADGVECDACHSDPDKGTLRDHTDVVFPSGVLVEGLGPEALCSECHQGRASKKTVDDDIADAGVPDDDTPSEELGFVNIHYHVAAATQFGTVVKGGYEYEGKTYDARFSHVTGYNACHTCHNPHSLHVDLGPCNTCHTGVTNPKNIRYYGSFVDYDGDGDTEEGMYYEINSFKNRLYFAIQRYATRIIGSPIGYDAHTYPYFFNDTNGNGVIDPEEADRSNGYSSFTARLLKACFNYQVALKDPNAYAHGGKYVIQLLYDSIADLNEKLKSSSILAGLSRDDEGHFAGSTEAWRHWDEDEYLVSGSCAKCHSAVGLQQLIETGENEETDAANGMLCTTCHSSPPAVFQFAQVEFPSGAVEDMGDASNLCLNCHQGRESGKSIREAIAAKPGGPYGFINIHYFPAAAILFGTEVKGGYEFGGKAYIGQRQWHNHNGQFDTCIECHMGTQSENKRFDYTGKMHNVHKPDPRDCVYCHGWDVSQPNPGSNPAKFKFSGIRPGSTPDYNGNGDRTESIESEIKVLEENLYAQIQMYAATVLGAPIVYDSHAYPYFFNDLNGNGIVDPGEAIYPNAYASFDAKLLRAAYNFQTSKKEPHGFIHNSMYIAQLLVDSIGH